MFGPLHKVKKIVVVVSLVDGLYDVNIKIHGYTKAHLSLKHIAIKSTTQYKICKKKCHKFNSSLINVLRYQSFKRNFQL